MNDDILISIVVPAYNLENYLEKTIDSILAQTHKNIEVIIVNDGSKDGTWGVIEKLMAKDSRAVGINKENGGVTSARLEGVAAAKGEHIGFVDGDDLVDPDMYERLLGNAVKYDADISHCGYKKNIGDKIVYRYNTGRLAVQDREAGLKDLLEGSFVEPGLWNKLYHKSLFHSLLHDDLMDRSVKNNEDLLMNYFLFKGAEKSVYEDFCPYSYIERSGSATTSAAWKNLLYNPSYVRELVIKDLEKDGYSEGDVIYDTARTSALRLYISAYTMLLRDDAAKMKDHKQYFRQKIIENKKYIKMLNRGGKMHAYAIMYAPRLCRPVFKILGKV